jgi:hypothetical protein
VSDKRADQIRAALDRVAESARDLAATTPPDGVVLMFNPLARLPEIEAMRAVVDAAESEGADALLDALVAALNDEETP